MTKSKITVIRNSTLLIIQPLLLNIISIFVIGYIARCLGQINYGKFTFVFAYLSIFTPFLNMGLGALTTREIAVKKDNSKEFFWKIFTLKLILSAFVFSFCIIIINILGYPIDTKFIVYIASLILLFNSITTTFNSAFQGFEKMEYIAFTNFISGIFLTTFSVVILMYGFRLLGLIVVYTTGSFVGLLVSIYYIYKIYPKIKLNIDISFFRKNLLRGFPLFLPGFFYIVSMKIGIILLSHISGEYAVGVFGAANNLVEKLIIIPDGICTAIFPTLASLYTRSQKEATDLYERFNIYLFVIGLPIAVGTTILADKIIYFIYGPMYEDSIIILKVLIWWLIFIFFYSYNGWSLGAIHLEKIAVKISIFNCIICVIFNYFFISYFGAIGASYANLVSIIISFILQSHIISKYFVNGTYLKIEYLKIILASLIMAIIVIFSKNFNLFLSIFLGIITYIYLMYILKFFCKNDVEIFIKKIKNKFI